MSMPKEGRGFGHHEEVGAAVPPNRRMARVLALEPFDEADEAGLREPVRVVQDEGLAREGVGARPWSRRRMPIMTLRLPRQPVCKTPVGGAGSGEVARHG
jgi:hypothetical protein